MLCRLIQCFSTPAPEADYFPRPSVWHSVDQCGSVWRAQLDKIILAINIFVFLQNVRWIIRYYLKLTILFVQKCAEREYPCIAHFIVILHMLQLHTFGKLIYSGVLVSLVFHVFSHGYQVLGRQGRMRREEDSGQVTNAEGGNFWPNQIPPRADNATLRTAS